MPPYSLQLYLSSSNCTFLNDTTKRNEINQIINEPIVVPDGYDAIVTIEDAQFPITWAILQKFILVRSNLASRNQMITGRYIGKIPVFVGNGYMNNYINYTNYGHHVQDLNITMLTVSLQNEDGSDVSFGAGFNWSITIQIDFKKI